MCSYWLCIGQCRYRIEICYKPSPDSTFFSSSYCLISLILFQADFQELSLCALSTFICSSTPDWFLSPSHHWKYSSQGYQWYPFTNSILKDLAAAFSIIDHSFLPILLLLLVYGTHIPVFLLPHTLSYFFFFFLQASLSSPASKYWRIPEVSPGLFSPLLLILSIGGLIQFSFLNSIYMWIILKCLFLV